MNFQRNKRTWDGTKKPQNTFPHIQQGQQRIPFYQTPLTIAGGNSDGCFNCGKPGHIAKNCRAPRNNSQPEIICHNCGKRGHLTKDCRAPNGGTYGQTGQARLNAIIPEGAGFDIEGQQNLEGTITLFHTQVKVLFDTGASNSFVVVKIMCELGLVPQALKTALNAISPLGVTVKLGKVCRDCPLTLEGRNFPGDLVVLSM